MRPRQLLALAPVVVLAAAGPVPAALAQDYVGPPPGTGSDYVGPPPGEGGDYVGLPPGGAPGGDYVGFPPGAGPDGDYVGRFPGAGAGDGADPVGADLVGVASPLPPRVSDLGGGGRGRDRRALTLNRPDEEGRPVEGLPVSTTDVVLLGGVAIIGLALAARRAHVRR